MDGVETPEEGDLVVQAVPEVLPQVEKDEAERKAPRALDAEPVQDPEGVGAGPFGREQRGAREDERGQDRVEHPEGHVRGIVPGPLATALDMGMSPSMSHMTPSAAAATKGL